MTIVTATNGSGKSLDDVHGTVSVSHRDPFRRLLAFLGPAYLVSVGYMDPGNWATDLEGGARFGYALLWVLLISNLMAVLLQTLSARLGVVTGHDLAQGCRAEYSPKVNFVLWVFAEVAIVACDLAEVLGTIIALKLLFGLPMIWGCLITILDTFLLLAIQRLGMRKMEGFILMLVATIGACFLIQVIIARPDVAAVLGGFQPRFPVDPDGRTRGSILVAAGILGATVMPHNLYLHSALVQSRRIGADRDRKAQACKYNLIDSALALNLAFFVNAAILILSASVFHTKSIAVASIEEAHRLLPSFLHPIAPKLFGIALLCAGQSSTLTGTLAGQIVMEGHLRLTIAPWLRRMITRSLALVPAMLVIGLTGEGATQSLLVLSQVVLSLQLPFAVIPLIHFTSNRRNMGTFASPRWVKALAWTASAVIVALNVKLVIGTVSDWIEALRSWGATIGPVSIATLAAIALYTGIFLITCFFLHIVIRPMFKRSPAWTAQPSVALDWSDALRPRSPRSIAVALEHSPADAEILSHALSMTTPAAGAKIILLHVVDTPMSRVYGDLAADRETDADLRYLDQVVRVLESEGYDAKYTLLHGPNRAGELIAQLRKEPVDLLVVGSHGHGVFRDLLFGQTVDSVRHGLDIPMLVTRPPRPSTRVETKPIEESAEKSVGEGDVAPTAPNESVETNASVGL
jgi:manganese transport protein